MAGTFILLVLCVCFAISMYFTFKAFVEGKMWERILGIITCCLLGFLIIITHFACIETTRNQTMQDYFEGKVEVIEQIDTTRTFKFN
jgi:hypothetical protein